MINSHALPFDTVTAQPCRYSSTRTRREREANTIPLLLGSGHVVSIRILNVACFPPVIRAAPVSVDCPLGRRTQLKGPQ